jgi:hypothetical protein
MPSYRNAGNDGSPEDKLAAVIETASLSEAEPDAYCRQKGLYPEPTSSTATGSIRS